MSDLGRLFARRAALLRELADLDEGIGRELGKGSDLPDEGIGLEAAARRMGEPKETFRRRLEYREALISRPGERRLRYSPTVLDRIRARRLTANAVILEPSGRVAH